LRKNNFGILAALIFTVLFASSSGLAQTSPATAPKTKSDQSMLNSLANLPEADTLIYINPQRILNEALPRVMPEADVAKMKSGLADVKQFAGIDPLKIDYVVVAVRSRKPSAELNFVPPEFIVAASGDFSADSLVMLARAAAGGKLRDEKYGSKSLSLLTIEDIAKQAEKSPFLKSFSDLAIAPLNANTIAAGTTMYLKAAVDAAEGNGRISAESLGSLLRDASVLISVAGSPLTSFNKSFGLLGTESNARAPRCDSKFGDFYAAVTMDATNFRLLGVMNADNPDTAKIIQSLLSGLLQQVVSSVKDKQAQSAFNSLRLTGKDNEILLRAEIPQQMVADLIREQMKAKPPAATAPSTPSAKPAVTRRKTRRRK
jgi:hypothetical protein